MPVKVCPSFDFWFNQLDELTLSHRFIARYTLTDTCINAFHRVLFGFGEAFTFVFAHVKS